MLSPMTQKGERLRKEDIPDIFRVDEEGRVWRRADTTVNGNYRKVCWDGRIYLAHRVVAAWAYGEVPEHAVVCHLDGDPLNNRPENLLVGTQSDNVKHQFHVHKTKNWKGEGHPQSKLTTEQVLKIRELHAKGVAQTSLAADFGVSARQISGIVNREYWTHI